MITYEQRVEAMMSVEDVGEQIRLAKAYMMRMRTAAKKEPTLARKVEAQRKVKEAESVLRRLRSNVFDLEDRFMACTHQQSSLQAPTGAFLLPERFLFRLFWYSERDN